MRSWIKQFDYAVFDCDGVILDSNAIKTQAFRESLPDQPAALVEELVDYHRERGGVSRFVKLRYFFETLKGEAESGRCAALVDDALDRFGAYCRDALAACDEIKGVRELLEGLVDEAVPLSVVSGASQSELRRLFEVRQLKGYFDHILGSPSSKIENMAWLQERGFLKGVGVFFGDSRADLEAADAFGLEFVFVRGRSEWEAGDAICARRGCRVVEHF